MPSSPELPPHLHTTKNLPSNLLPTFINAFKSSISSFSEILETLKPDLLIYDLFQPWAAKLALSQGIPCVYFVISGATASSFYRHLYTKGTASTYPYPAIYMLDHEMNNVREVIKSASRDPDKDFALENYTMSSDIVLVKSCREVEEKYIDYLGALCKKRIVPTGPLIGRSDQDEDEEEEDSGILKWLSGKSYSSTVYISFGSEHFFTESEIEKIAKGLQLCNANFIWVIRFPLGEQNIISLEDKLPRGFLDITKGRGMVVSRWAPQARILAHSSIGGFLSHCGWNSVTESMYFGVPIIAMPMKYEQPLTARMVVEAELAKAINKVVITETTVCEGLRNTSKKLSDKIKEKEEEEVNQVAEQLLRLCMKNKQ
ncbi:hypothetical protein BUALT_Bualt16G0116800 [Buddleja alternifolia]|uniref:Glycosyltransferase n=1 Tax=Buddleja alternifolia TaxID=168488 RepID=A0AAV6WCE6_9LAMI|nr:hypothetical protein BUALT_Bualt16G0116800 [Buddleja alternifolia]